MRYGLDAPSVVAGFYLGAVVAFFAFLVILVSPVSGTVAFIGGLVFLFIFFYALVNGSLMVYSSMIGKIRLARKVIEKLKLKGDEHVLDVGCGQGLYAIEIGKVLTLKNAVGIDIWQSKDLSRNTRDKALANANAAGVNLDLIECDMRQMPFGSSSFDIVVSALAVHNVPGKVGRSQAVREMARVARKRLVIIDFCKMDEYTHTLKEMGWSEIELSRPCLQTFPPSRVLYAEKPS